MIEQRIAFFPIFFFLQKTPAPVLPLGKLPATQAVNLEVKKT